MGSVKLHVLEGMLCKWIYFTILRNLVRLTAAAFRVGGGFDVRMCSVPVSVVLPVHARALPARALPTRARGSTRPRAVA